MERRRKVAIGAGVVALTITVAIAIAALGGAPGSHGSSIGAAGGTVSAHGVEIKFPPGAVRHSTEVEVRPVEMDATDLFPHVTPRSQTFQVEMKRALRRPATVSIPILAKPRPGATLLLATREASGQMWILQRGSYDPGSGRFSLQMREFSFMQVVESVEDKAISAGTTASKKLLEVGGVRAAEPSCSDPPIGYRIEGDVGQGDANALVYACLEGQGEGLAVRIVNNRGIGMAVKLPTGFHTIETHDSNLPDTVLNALPKTHGGDNQTVSSAGEVSIAGPRGRADLTVKPTLGSFAFDLALFAAGQLGGKAGRSGKAAVDFLECANGFANRLSDRPPRSLEEGFYDAGLPLWRACGGALVRAGAGAIAEAGAAFFGGFKSGVGSLDAGTALLFKEKAELRIRPAPVTAGTVCGLVKSGRTWNPYGDLARPLEAEVEVAAGSIFCKPALGTLSWYLKLDPESACASDAGNTCVLEHEGWTCYAPPPPQFPVLTICQSGGVELHGIDPNPVPTGSVVHACEVEPRGPVGPYNLKTNLLSCGQARSVAESTLYHQGGDQIHFTCTRRLTGIESEHDVCHFGNAMVTYDAGA